MKNTEYMIVKFGDGEPHKGRCSTCGCEPVTTVIPSQVFEAMGQLDPRGLKPHDPVMLYTEYGGWEGFARALLREFDEKGKKKA